MADPMTLAMVGAGAGALLDKKDPLRGAALGGMGGWGASALPGLAGAAAGGGGTGLTAGLAGTAMPASMAGQGFGLTMPAGATLGGAGSGLGMAGAAGGLNPALLSGAGAFATPSMNLAAQGTAAQIASRQGISSMIDPNMLQMGMKGVNMIGGGQQQAPQPTMAGGGGMAPAPRAVDPGPAGQFSKLAPQGYPMEYGLLGLDQLGMPQSTKKRMQQGM